MREILKGKFPSKYLINTQKITLLYSTVFHLFHQLFLDLYTMGIFFVNVNETGLDSVLLKSMSFTEPQNVTLFENMVIADVSTSS